MLVNCIAIGILCALVVYQTWDRCFRKIEEKTDNDSLGIIGAGNDLSSNSAENEQGESPKACARELAASTPCKTDDPTLDGTEFFTDEPITEYLGVLIEGKSEKS